METINEPEGGSTSSAIAGQDQTILPLSELIAEIDSETAMPFDSGRKKEKLSPKFDEVDIFPFCGPTIDFNSTILFSNSKIFYAVQNYSCPVILINKSSKNFYRAL